MNNNTFTKGMGCLGSLLTLGLSIICSYLSLRFGWGLEVKNWSAYIWFGVVGFVVLFALSHLFAQLTKD